jgi:hypothetical protein
MPQLIYTDITRGLVERPVIIRGAAAGEPDILYLHRRYIAGPELLEIVGAPEKFEAAAHDRNGVGADEPAVNPELQQMPVEIAMERKTVPIPVEFRAVDGEADARKILTDDDPEAGGTLIVNEVDILVVTVPADGNNAEDIPKINLMPRKEANVERQLEFL